LHDLVVFRDCKR